MLLGAIQVNNPILAVLLKNSGNKKAPDCVG
jgi:hypothetical protein